jgi:hypothetical protein
LVDPVAKILLKFTFLPKKALGFTPSAILPAHVMDYYLLTL